MHVNAKKMAVGGLLLALSVVCMILGSVIETNTLFLLAAASYFVGIIIREMGLRTGAAFYLAAILLGFIVAPNKFYVLSFAAMGFYILAVEVAFVLLGKMTGAVNRKVLFWILKYLVFNLMYIPMLLFFQQLLFGKSLPGIWLIGVIAAGQLGLWIYDRAYEYVQAHLWGKMRGRLL
ncbi:hypothetical protein HGO97_003370 [Faecalicatena sp. AGMB00832]|uniref:DUF2232 domain-containing protein n=1 Tax=Faecalicatena faecalis TaxID=2726362 RepID=A0ABS6CZV2_9FIRM|nr:MULTISPECIES: hypothetical protein [Faecalicatena]MBU3874854.1 hypothetical protein [Faecalicatena faecalis]MCI6465778.1 hypothetical protein [Faecalicatena sp.]MDY5618806.1 hypothetical protein [Lachnospiraceae bacterium]